MADGMVPVVVSPEPFGRGTIDLELSEGATVRDLLREAIRAGMPVESLGRAEIYVDGVRLDRATATDHVLQADEVINVVVEPLGGGGGGRKDIGQILLSVAVIAVAGWVGGGAGGAITSKLLARMLATAVTMVGQAAIAGMNRPKASEKANDRYALQSGANQYRLFGPQPVALGEVIVAPDFAAKTFTRNIGDDVWLYGILGLHRGACQVDEIRIGDTLVSSMGAGDFRMAQHLTPGPRVWQLYNNDVDQLDLTEKLEATPSSATPIVRAASSDGAQFDFDFFLPSGLWFGKDDGRVLSVTVGVQILYRPIDEHGVATGGWQSAPSASRTSSSKDPQRFTHSVNLPHGRYEFEVQRTRPADGNDKRRDDITWTALKAIAYRAPITDETLSVIEFAVRATAINQGGLAPITCRIKPLIPIFNGVDWNTIATSSNPAAVARWLMTGECAAHPMPAAQADMRLRAWYGLCEEYGWTAHHYLTSEASQEEALALLEKSGRASLFDDGTQLAASCWVEKPAPKQMFTGANLRDHTFEIVYPEPVHAFRVKFANIEQKGEEDEVIVFADGYAEVAGPGVEAATLYEQLQLEGQMTLERAYLDGRWALGQRIHQRRFDSWTTDVEYLACEYGDRVRLSQTRASGPSLRVRNRRFEGALVSGLRLTDAVEMVAGVDYVVDMRTATGIHTGVPVLTTPGMVRELVFAAPRAEALTAKAGDLVEFGEPERTTEDVEIVGIAPGENLTAILTGVRYVAPLLMAGETGPIPPLQSHLTGERQVNPPQPTLLGMQVDANGVRISFDMPVWRGSPLSGFSVRWRAAPASGELSTWSNLPALSASAREVVTPPLREAPVDIAGEEATRFEFEIVAMTVDGRVSKPLLFVARKNPPPVPSNTEWDAVPLPPLASGQQVPFFLVTGVADHPDVVGVRISFAKDAEGVPDDSNWLEGYYGPPQSKGYQIGPLVSGVQYWVQVQFLSAQGTPSHSLMIGPRLAGQLVAGDTTHLNGEPVQDILDKLTDVESLSASNAQAVADLDGRVDGVITEAEAILAGAEGAAALATLEAGKAGEAATASNVAAGIATTKADEAGNHATAANAERLLAEAAKEEADNSASASVLAAAQADASAGEAGDWAAASEGSAVQAGAHAADGLAYRNQAVDARDGAVAASLAAGTSASAAQDAEESARAEKVAAQNAAATSITQASNAGAAASSAQISANLAAKSGVQNEWDNADLSQGTKGFTQQWGGASGNITIENPNGSRLAVRKTGGGLQEPGMVSMGSVEFGGGPFGAERTSYNMRSWRVAAGERIGIAFDARDESAAAGGAPARWAIVVRIFNNDGSVWGGVPNSDFQSTYGNNQWHRVGRVFTVPVDGYLTVEAYLQSQGTPATTVVLEARHFVFARMRPDATEIPAYSAPAGGGALSEISSQLSVTAAVAANTADQVGSARFGVTGGAGGDPFDLELQAGPDGSTASLTASALRLKNIINGMVHRVMDIVGGFVHIMGPLYIGPNREIELNPISGYPFISIRVGAGRIAMGRLPNDNLIYWFGPFQEVVNMRKNNATEWRDTSGRAYFGGSILAGTISNSVQGSSSLYPVSVKLGPFATNGGPITIAWAYDFSRMGERWGKQDTTVTGSCSALVRLYRKIGTGDETLVDTMAISGTYTVNYEPEPWPGQPVGTVGKTYFTEFAGGSRTFTDNVGGTQSRTYRVEVVSRTNISVSGDSAMADDVTQKYGAVSSE